MTIFKKAVVAATRKELSAFNELILEGEKQKDIRCIVFNEMYLRYMIRNNISRRDKAKYIKDNYDSLLINIPYEEYEKDVYGEDSDIKKEYYENCDDEALENDDFIDWYLIKHIGIPESIIENHWYNIISEKNKELITILIKAILNMSEEELLNIMK